MIIQTNSTDPNIIAANPAKGFFVSMLIKDITLRDAIGDLVDNAVDAIKARAENPLDLKGYEIEINLSKDSFSIKDNGFGMEAKVARETAFNFGKSDQHKLIDKSIGQFGIGMKRAFFKLGRNIKVKSVAKTSQFELIINVDEWLKEPEKWEFEFDSKTLKENIENNSSETGLEVRITNLSDDSKASFIDKTFIDQLQKEISLEHMININKGLSINIDGFNLKSNEITLVYDDNIKPTFWEEILKEQSVKILAGISVKDNGDEGGWYIFCNDRLIVAKNQQKETGWGDGLPKYHSQYYKFRGYVFFEALNSSNLPWNTTKTGMDMDSPYFKKIKMQMIIMTRQVMGLLDKLKDEKTKDNPEDNQTLNKAVNRSLNETVTVVEVLKKTNNLNSTFQYPAILFNPPKKNKSIKISYQVTNDQFEAVSQHIGEKNPKEVGLKTFKYYSDNEL